MEPIFLPVVENFPVVVKEGIILTVTIRYGSSGAGTGSGIFTPVFYEDAGNEMLVRSIHPYFLFLNDFPDRPKLLAANPFSHTRQTVSCSKIFELVWGPFAVIQNLLAGNDNADGSEWCRQKDGEDGNGQD